ncbi:MAG: CsiV family protein, partial [Gammaproteobacteria bacterium]|nr:CsiV family protein [Gammaproteobacteria bacterium]
MRRGPARYAAAALFAAGLGAPSGAAEPEFGDWLTYDWHVVEVVVFLHRSPQTREAVTTFEPRRYPLPLTAFDPPPSAWRFPALHDVPAEEGPFPPAWMWMDDPAGIPLPDTGADGPPDTVEAVPPPSPLAIPPAPETVARDAFAAYEAALVRASMQWRTDGLVLAAHVRRMRRSADYEVLHHGRWFQATRAPARAIPMLLRIGPPHTDGVSRIEGTLRVARGLYVEVDAELWLHEEAAGPGADRQGYARLAETRRMRTGDVHYLDHPKIGLVLRADRLDVPDALAALVEAVEEGLQ